jgi:hypothetical protein
MYRTLAVVACLLAAPLAQAQVYKWTDASGTVHFAQSPPPQGTRYAVVPVAGGEGASGTEPAPAPASAAAPARAAPGGGVADTPDNRGKLCADLSGNIGLLQSGQPLTVDDAQGNRVAMDDARRQQELASAQDQYRQYCPQ